MVSILLVILIDLVFTALFYVAKGGSRIGDMADPIISASDLRVRYGDREVLHGLTFEVRRGETLVVIGGSGSGKSTLLRTLVGLEKPSAGEVLDQGCGHRQGRRSRDGRHPQDASAWLSRAAP